METRLLEAIVDGKVGIKASIGGNIRKEYRSCDRYLTKLGF